MTLNPQIKLARFSLRCQPEIINGSPFAYLKPERNRRRVRSHFSVANKTRFTKCNCLASQLRGVAGEQRWLHIPQDDAVDNL